MASIPANPKIYHITHVNNLPGILQDGVVWSDAKRLEKSLECMLVGMSRIKRRRLEELEVDCHPGTKVGEYVPFYFCPRSVMLYILYRANNPDLTYRGGQRPMVHIQVDLMQAIRWAETNNVAWAISDTNAGAGYARFFNHIDDLEKIHWPAVEATNFGRGVLVDGKEVIEGKQAEFLLWEALPWSLVEEVGVIDDEIASQVRTVLPGDENQPDVIIRRGWYY